MGKSQLFEERRGRDVGVERLFGIEKLWMM